MNEYSGIGNLTKDPIFGDNGTTQYCNFTIAINNRNTDPSYLNIVAFGKQAHACNDYLKKGSQIYVKGTPDVDAWIDKNGDARASLKIKAREVEFLSRTKEKNKELSNMDKVMNNINTNQVSYQPNNRNQSAR